MVTFSDLDISRYLNTEEKRLAYLNAILEDADEAQNKTSLKLRAKSLNPRIKTFGKHLKS
ncbi:hypothetical protein [Helicobacter mehlei]|uniref:Uncharacterized protein n=1 Tax=Helicobacter mehlei TaxID=2316080 RepID=A0A553UL82_9HELI|nr:hypothetical protein [Helicobacter mehlei]TSA80811.1 hypothetical protein FNE76_07125 [Helicobacter mehlei]